MYWSPRSSSWPLYRRSMQLAEAGAPCAAAPAGRARRRRRTARARRWTGAGPRPAPRPAPGPLAPAFRDASARANSCRMRSRILSICSASTPISAGASLDRDLAAQVAPLDPVHLDAERLQRAGSPSGAGPPRSAPPTANSRTSPPPKPTKSRATSRRARHPVLALRERSHRGSRATAAPDLVEAALPARRLAGVRVRPARDGCDARLGDLRTPASAAVADREPVRRAGPGSPASAGPQPALPARRPRGRAGRAARKPRPPVSA